MGTKICKKFDSEETLTTGDVSYKSDSKREQVGSCVACSRSDRLSTKGSKTQIPWFRNCCDRHHYHCSPFSFFLEEYVFLLVFVLRVLVFHVIIYVAMLYILGVETVHFKVL